MKLYKESISSISSISNLWRYNMLTIKDIIHDYDNEKTIITLEDEKGHIFDTTYNGIRQRKNFERIFQGGII